MSKLGNYVFRNQLIIYAFLLYISNYVFSQPSKYEYKIPQQLNDGWKISSLSDQGLDTKKIESIANQMLTEERFENVLSMLILKNGKLVHEAYSPYVQRNTLHWMASITKAVTSTLIGIAIDKGFIESVNSGVGDHLPEFKNAIKDPEFNKIKIKHIMSMSSGLDWTERSSYNAAQNSEHQMVDTQDWMRFVLSRPVMNEPGTHFLYNTGGIHLLSAVIKSATGLYVNEFAEKYLLHPLGIRAYQWNRDPMGYPCTGGTDGGIGLRTRDLAKFGWLFLKDGTWKGKRIISQKWIKEATQKHISRSSGTSYYGYNWIPGSKTVNGITFDYIAAFGYGGQTLYLVPELDLIIIFTCELTEGNANIHLLVNQTFETLVQD
jgi:CubicO group peptidase (beta-lactamase class C family)